MTPTEVTQVIHNIQHLLTEKQRILLKALIYPTQSIADIAKSLDRKEGYIRQLASEIYDLLYQDTQLPKQKRGKVMVNIREHLFIANPIFENVLNPTKIDNNFEITKW